MVRKGFPVSLEPLAGPRSRLFVPGADLSQAPPALVLLPREVVAVTMAKVSWRRPCLRLACMARSGAARRPTGPTFALQELARSIESQGRSKAYHRR